MAGTAHPELTRNQALVLKALDSAEGPLGAYAILDRLRDKGFRAPLQVYRECHAHATIAFAICDKCGRVSEFGDEDVEDRLGTWAKEHKFKPTKTTIEIRGFCEKCASEG